MARRKQELREVSPARGTAFLLGTFPNGEDGWMCCWGCLRTKIKSELKQGQPGSLTENIPYWLSQDSEGLRPEPAQRHSSPHRGQPKCSLSRGTHGFHHGALGRLALLTCVCARIAKYTGAVCKQENLSKERNSVIQASIRCLGGSQECLSTREWQNTTIKKRRNNR
jgi:hypothetical protein